MEGLAPIVRVCALLCLALPACSGRAVIPARADGAGVQPDDPVATGPAVQPDDAVATGPCSGEDRAVLSGAPFAFTELSASRQACGSLDDPQGECFSVTFGFQGGGPMDSSSSYWNGIVVTVISPAAVQPPGFPLQLDLGALPQGWKVIAGIYSGSCAAPDGPCKSNMSPLLWEPTCTGSLQVSAGAPQTISLCLDALDKQDTTLFAYARSVAVETE